MSPEGLGRMGFGNRPSNLKGRGPSERRPRQNRIKTRWGEGESLRGDEKAERVRARPVSLSQRSRRGRKGEKDITNREGEKGKNPIADRGGVVQKKTLERKRVHVHREKKPHAIRRHHKN